jgi:hypothetical protein
MMYNVFESSRVLYKCAQGHESLLNVQNEAPVCYECKLDAYEKGHSVELERTKGELAAARNAAFKEGIRAGELQSRLDEAVREREIYKKLHNVSSDQRDQAMEALKGAANRLDSLSKSWTVISPLVRCQGGVHPKQIGTFLDAVDSLNAALLPDFTITLEAGVTVGELRSGDVERQ